MWLESYISLKTKYRTKAKSGFEENQYKFLTNAVFAKLIQKNIEERGIQLVTNEITRNRLNSSVDLKESKYNSGFLQIFEIKENKIKMNSSMFVRELVLDLSKIFLYEIYCD